MFYVYFLLSRKNKKCYIGFSEKDSKIRVKEHNYGSNEWTKNNGPFDLIYYEKYFCEKDARQRERFYKSGVGRRIVKIIIKEFGSSVFAKGEPAYGGG